MAEKDFDELHPKIALGVAAHPDDLDFGAAGTFAKWASEGTEVYYLIITDGSKGSDDENFTPEKLTQTRENEQRNAAKIIGAKDVFFLGYPDAYLEVTMDLKKDISRHIRKIKPDVVVTTDPTVIYSLESGYVNHTDHRAAGQATIDAVFPLARDRLTFPELMAEGLTPHKTKTLLLTNFGGGNYCVDITNFIDKKLEALAAHASQISDMESTKGRIREFAQRIGQKSGYECGESFNRLDLF